MLCLTQTGQGPRLLQVSNRKKQGGVELACTAIWGRSTKQP